jgi:hypothetical protein
LSRKMSTIPCHGVRPSAESGTYILDQIRWQSVVIHHRRAGRPRPSTQTRLIRYRIQPAARLGRLRVRRGVIETRHAA